MEFAADVHPEASLSVTWKVHVLVAHLPQFLRRYNMGMSAFAEQCTESVHHDFKKTAKRFLVHEDHEDFAKKLMRAIVEYNSRRL